MAADLARASNTSKDKNQPIQVYIDGKYLHTYAEQYSNFKKDENIEKFFKEILIEKMKKPIENEKETTTFFLETLHQGGLLYPVTSALSVVIQRNATEKKSENASYVDNNRVSEATIGNTV